MFLIIDHNTDLDGRELAGISILESGCSLRPHTSRSNYLAWSPGAAVRRAAAGRDAAKRARSPLGSLQVNHNDYRKQNIDTSDWGFMSVLVDRMCRVRNGDRRL
jgi:hypothetical protein